MVRAWNPKSKGRRSGGKARRRRRELVDEKLRSLRGYRVAAGSGGGGGGGGDGREAPRRRRHGHDGEWLLILINSGCYNCQVINCTC